MYIHSVENKPHRVLKKQNSLKKFEEMYNVGIHVPQKDKCSKCGLYKNTQDKNIKFNTRI